MKPSHIFESCLENVHKYRPLVSPTKAVRIVERTDGTGHASGKRSHWMQHYILDFELIAKRVLRRRPKQYRVFLVYFLHDIEYQAAAKQLHITTNTLDWHAHHIKREVGKELERSGMFPIAIYKGMKLKEAR